MNNQEIITKLAIYKKEIKDAEKSVAILEKMIITKSEKVFNINSAVEILAAVLSITQEEIVVYIENVVTTALQYIYGDEYTFKIDYLFKRSQPEVEMYPIKNGLRYEPKFSCGVGVLDVCAFALRCACWSLIEPQPTSVMVMDEPFRFISGNEQMEKCSIMVKELSKLLGIQFIIISAKNDLINMADRIFEINIEKGISHIVEK